jgi:hypothetical protein
MKENKLKRLMKMLALIPLLCLAVALPIAAQSTSGSMSGNVQDKQGAAIANATVTLVDQDKETKYTSQTDSQGRFVFPQLPPGLYTLTIEGSGFKKLERKDVTLNASDKMSLGDLALEVGTVKETIEVQAEGAVLKTESAERSDALVGEQLQNVAVNSRSYLSLTNLIPGVVSTVNLQTAGHSGLSSISANGARVDQNQLTLNGIGNVDTGNNGDQLATISLDSVQEFKILTSNYQAEYGRSAGAQIIVVTKSGASEFHGSGYLFHRNEGLNANNWKNNRDGIPRGLYRFNDAGYTIGGPIVIPGLIKSKEKLFFFWSQEYQEQLRPQAVRNQTVPTALERKGDFSQSVTKDGVLFNTIKDPLSSLPCNSTATGANPLGCFADGGVLGRIPQNRLFAPSLALLSVFPLPNFLVDKNGNPNKGFNFTSQIPDSYPRREDLLRIDYNLNSKWRIWGHFLNNSDAITTQYGSFVLAANVPLDPITDSRPGKSIAVGATTVINSSTTNEMTFGYGHNFILIDATTNALTRTAVGATNLPMLFPSAIQEDFIPTFQYNGNRIANQATFGTGNAPFTNYNSTLDFVDNFSKIIGPHTIKIGGYFQRSRKNQTAFANANGSINFGDGNGNPFDTGYGFANIAIGAFQTFNQASAYATGQYRYSNFETYVQDTWKVSQRLTVDYGMRFYWMQPQFDAGLKTGSFQAALFDKSKAVRLYQPALDSGGNRIGVDPGTGATTSALNIGKIVPGSGDISNGIGQAGKNIDKYLMDNQGIQFGPRIGVAWDPTGKHNMVVRAGAGIFYDRIQGNEVFDMITNPPTTVAPTITNGTLQSISSTNLILAPLNVFGFDPRGKIPTIYNYSVGIQYKLPKEVVLDVAYVGSVSNHLLNNQNLNAIPYGATFLKQNQDPTKFPGGVVPDSDPTIASIYTAAGLKFDGSKALPVDLLRPFPGFGTITLHNMDATANYNSMQVTINRRFTRGLFLGVAYTYSKAMSTTPNTVNDTEFFRIDGQTRSINYGPAAFDRRHNVAINYVYDFPKVQSYWKSAGDNKVARAILNDWQISGITRFLSGNPYSVTTSIGGSNNSSQNVTGSYTEGFRVKLVGDPTAGASGPYNLLNAAAFTVPLVGSIGNDSPFNYLTTPGINNWDISLQRTVRIKERVRMEFRVDAFNAFNHTQFSGVNSTINLTSTTNATPTNLVFKSDGTINNINGFGSVSGARDPRILQLVCRLVF